MKIVKVYKESLPRLTLVGKRYTNKDRDASGTFATFWRQCFQEGWPDILKQCTGIPGLSDDLVGAMRMLGEGVDFEYWIGAFVSPEAETPAGFQSVELAAGELGICWLCGNDKNGELYSMQASDLSMSAFAEQGWRYSEQGWFFERYHHSRFTEADAEGNVILDICAYLL